MTTQNIDNAGRLAIEIIYDSFENSPQIDHILTLGLDDDEEVYGTLLSGGEFYGFAINQDSVYTKHYPTASQEIKDYIEGSLASDGIEIKQDNYWEWSKGFLHLDAKKAKCIKGSACGSICLPKGRKCRKNKSASKTKSVKGKLRQSEAPEPEQKTGRRRRRRRGRVARFVGGAALAAGGLVGAGVGGYLGAKAIKKGFDKKYENDPEFRDKVDRNKSKVNAAKNEIKLGVEEGKRVFKTGMAAAKLVPENPSFANRDKRGIQGAAVGGGAGKIIGGLQNAGKILRGKYDKPDDGSRSLPAGKDREAIASKSTREKGGAITNTGFNEPITMTAEVVGGELSKSASSLKSLPGGKQATKLLTGAKESGSKLLKGTQNKLLKAAPDRRTNTTEQIPQSSSPIIAGPGKKRRGRPPGSKNKKRKTKKK